MDFKQLQSFIAVAKYKNFTTAAEKSYLSQSTISSHIRQLEEELNVQLFNRTTKMVEVTAIGMELYKYATNILDLKKRIELCCESDNNHTIYLGASTIPSAYLLPPIMSSYTKLHPDVSFTIRQDDSQGVIEQLKEGVIDVGVIGSSCTDSDIICTPLCEDRMVFLTPNTPEYQKLKEEPETPIYQLLRSPLIFREEGSGSQRRIHSFIKQYGVNEDDLRIIARIDDQEAIKNLVANNFGVTMISERAVRDTSLTDRILIFPLPDEFSLRKFYVIYKKSSTLKDYTAKFVRYLSEHAAE